MQMRQYFAYKLDPILGLVHVLYYAIFCQVNP